MIKMLRMIFILFVLGVFSSDPTQALWGSMSVGNYEEKPGSSFAVTVFGTTSDSIIATWIAMPSYNDSFARCDSFSYSGCLISNAEIIIPVIVANDSLYDDYLYVWAVRDKTLPYNDKWPPLANQPLLKIWFTLLESRLDSMKLDLADSTQLTGGARCRSIFVDKPTSIRYPAITDGRIRKILPEKPVIQQKKKKKKSK